MSCDNTKNPDDYSFLMTPYREQSGSTCKGDSNYRREARCQASVSVTNRRDMSIQESLDVEAEVEEDNVSFAVTSVPLPGFDDTMSCCLCQIRIEDNCSSMEKRISSHGASLAEFICVATELFEQNEGRPAYDIVEEIREKLCAYGKSCGLPLLLNISHEEVFRHFKYDHSHVKRTNRKEKMMRILDGMLTICVSTCCERCENGRIALNNADDLLVLNIMDRMLRVQSVKEDNK